MTLDKVAGCQADSVATNCVPGNDFNFIEASGGLYEFAGKKVALQRKFSVGNVLNRVSKIYVESLLDTQLKR